MANYGGTPDDNVILGGDDNDILSGKAGDDRLEGGPGNHVLEGGAGADEIDGGEDGGLRFSPTTVRGSIWGDTATYVHSDTGVTIDLAMGTVQGGHAEGDTLTGIESIRGSDHADWSCRSMAKAAGVSRSTVQPIWDAHGLQPHRVTTFKLSTDPAFVEKLTDVVGLYLNPPDKAVVLSVDEKSQIQALDRTQPGLRR